MKWFRLVNDDDGHNYLIPEDLMDTFIALLESGEDDCYEAFNHMFSKYNLGGAITQLRIPDGYGWDV